MQPSRVNRYWLEGREDLMPPAGKRLTGRDMKRAKIQLAGQTLDNRTELDVVDDLLPFATDFVSTCKKLSMGKQTVGQEHAEAG